ncbi:Panacea domain-containing protein [Bacillus thuringiensis]
MTRQTMARPTTSITNVANYFLHLSSPGTPRGISPLKLQKLSFYAQALSYAINEKPLFDEDFQAWVHGPVSPDLYYKFKEFRSKDIDSKISRPEMDSNDANVIRLVWNMYGAKDGKFLENKTHNEAPWQNARKGLNYYDHSNKIIDKDEIEKYYSKKFRVKKVN